MMIVKGKVLSVIAFLLLASSLAVVNASRTRTPFYFKAVVLTMTMEWEHPADNSHLIMKIVEGGNVESEDGQTVGTWAMDIVEVLSGKTGRGTASGHLGIDFNSGVSVEGTITAKIQMYIGTSLPPDVDGKFVGHGDMHVMSDLYLIMEERGAGNFVPVLVLDGYSW